MKYSQFAPLLLSQVLALELKPQELTVSYFDRNNSLDCFQIESSATGWVAFGIGSSTMNNVDIHSAYLSSKQLVVDRRIGRGHGLPAINTRSPAFITTNVFDAPSWSLISASFCRPRNEVAQPLIVPNQKYIWAFGDMTPDGKILDFHGGNFGSFEYDFLTDSGKKEDIPVVIIVAFHGIIMWIAWILFPLLGVFVARYMKNLLGPVWFTIHQVFMSLTIILSIVGVAVLFFYLQYPFLVGNTVLENLHFLGGALIVILSVMQAVLGFLADRYFDEYRTSVPLLDRSHHFLGRLLFLGAVVNSSVGLTVFDAMFGLDFKYQIAHWAFVGVAIVVFGFAEVLTGPAVHVVSGTDNESAPLLD